MDKLIYLDNAATTKTSPEVVEAMLPYFTEHYGNPSSIYSFAAANKEVISKQRETIAGVIGTLYGALAGYVGGWIDNVMMRFSEMILSFPSLILAMIINAVMGSNLFNTMFALVIVSWPTYARLMRSVVLSVKENEYVTASEALGASKLRILMFDIIPNSVSSVLIMATTDIGNKILMFSTLSFLGLGSAPPTPEWGMMVSDGVDYFNKFWVAGFPGLAIFTMAVGANFIGDGLRDLLDPKLRTQF